MKMRMSKIFQKTMLLNFALFSVISISMSLVSALTLYDHMVDEYISKGKAIARSIASSSVEIILNRDTSTVQSMIDQFKTIDGASYVYVQDGDGEIISHTFVPMVPLVLQNNVSLSDEIIIQEITLPGVGKVIDIKKSILAGMAGYVHVGMDKELITRYVWIAIAKLQVVMFFIFWGSVFLLYLSVNRISEPLNKLTEYARKLSDHDFTASVEITSKDEIGLLATTMQSMAGEITSVISGLEQAVSNATGELQNTLTYMEVIIDNLADGLLVVDLYGKISLTNPALSDLFGIEGDDLKGKAVNACFSVEMNELFNHAKGCENEVCTSEIKLIKRRTGKAVATSINKKDAMGKPTVCIGVVILIRDITYEKEVDTLKTDFISTVSHELRTPMTSILGFAKIIKKKLNKSVFPNCTLPDKKSQRAIIQIQDNIEIIVSEGQRLTFLINDVLDIAKMESGKVDWKNESIDMKELVMACKQSTNPLWAAKNLEFMVEIERELPVIFGDRDRILQILVNLISNAVKFTVKGSITCKVRIHDEGVHVSVRDTGSGISPQDQKHIFERFKQVGDTLTGKPQGTGLGLPICKQIVAHHNGRIWVESKRGKGSSFHFILGPGESSADTCDISARSRAHFAGKGPGKMNAPLILVADDDPALNEFLSQILEEEGYRVINAKDGADAVVKASSHMPDIITMDLKMPIMDGAEAIRQLRMDPATRHIPVIVISALAEGKRAGGDASLIKPIEEQRLIETIHGMLQDDLVMTDPCMVLGRDEDAHVENLLVICPGKIKYCAPSEVWNRVASGFKGTLFVPAEISTTLNLDRLSSIPDVQLVIIPDQ